VFIYSVSIYRLTECHGFTFTGKNFANTSDVRTSALLEWFKQLGYKFGTEVILNGMPSLLNFMKTYQLDQKFLGHTHTHTHRERERERERERKVIT
jgi:hypothetical protein